MAKRTRILTSNKEIFNKLNNLQFVDEVFLDINNVKESYVRRILSNINRDSELIKIKVFDDKIKLSKNNKLYFNIYLKS